VNPNSQNLHHKPVGCDRFIILLSFGGVNAARRLRAERPGCFPNAIKLGKQKPATCT